MDNGWKKLHRHLASGHLLSYMVGMRHRLADGHRARCHSHPNIIEIVFHPSGCGHTTVFPKNRKPERVDFSAGDAILYAPDLPHEQLVDNGGEDWCVQAVAPSGLRLSGCLRIPAIADTALCAEIETLARSLPTGPDACHGAPDAGKPDGLPNAISVLLDIRTSAIMLHVLELAVAADSAVARRGTSFSMRAARQVEAAERYVQQHHDEIESLSEVARHVGLSHDHLRHVFRKVRGRSLVRYLNEIRIARARTLLAHTMFPLKEVADLCGFCDEYYFSAQFRRLCGVAPGAYREQHRTSQN
ncbi:AraC family transcriptional regulator [Geminisphaera colitermitum]|uniref:AraC family transcriptional regulator n=1 Tax=Geminisphaera colitermitum TaxID=1148786 RepID=UPI000158C852|nr:helix-turn-helix domain-containing protein [Geminisphaera colitermitum]